MGVKKRYLLEAALRPIVEFYSAALAIITAVFAWLFQYYLLMPPVIAGGAVVLLVLYALWRLRDGFKIRFYLATGSSQFVHCARVGIQK